ncbi:MAG: tripartite tricarboxylate transporter substrate binding protein [Betaproteobacteria bacterium]|nr:tripartite tricarboxylate transporter substrate binding protein [Betaproteobacteria bacterium]
MNRIAAIERNSSRQHGAVLLSRRARAVVATVLAAVRATVLATVLANVLAAVLATAASAVLVESALAQSWPARTITLVVPFPPGGGPDLFARILTEKLPPRLGQTMLVDNRPGVGGLAGANVVAKSAPDGHMFLIAPNTIAIAPHVLPAGAGGGVDVMRDLVPVILPAATPMMLVVNPSLGAKTVAELVAIAKQRPGLPYASAGNGSPMHIAGELFRKAAGVDLQHIPYKGVAPSVADTLGGQVQVLFVAMGGGIAQHLRSGKLQVLAVTERRRTALLPNVPTLAELGYKGVETDAWYGVLAPSGTPQSVIARMNQEINALLAMADVRERMNSAGIDVRGGTPEAFGAEMREDHARYGRIVREFGIKAD